MGKYRKRNLYHETTDSRTFRILHISSETFCCLRCARRRSRGWYGSYNTPARPMKIPSWKLASKNRKQWMKKPLKYSYKTLRRPWAEDWVCCTINW